VITLKNLEKLLYALVSIRTLSKFDSQLTRFSLFAEQITGFHELVNSPRTNEKANIVNMGVINHLLLALVFFSRIM
jgi:hypothetical protein